MSGIKHDWERLSNEESRLLKEDLILFFKNELDVEIGVIAAEKILKFFQQLVTNYIIKELMTQKERLRIDMKNYSLT
jgi:hypothetical protein